MSSIDFHRENKHLGLDNSFRKIEMEGDMNTGKRSCTDESLLLIYPGQDVGEKIRSFFQHRENFPLNLKEKTCWGVIKSATGHVSCPEVETLGSSLSAEGDQLLIKLSGTYKIPKDGDVRVFGGLSGIFTSPGGDFLCGHVVDPLVAASVVEVVVSYTELENEGTSKGNLSLLQNET